MALISALRISFGKPVFRDTDCQHAAGHRQGLEDRHPVAFPGEEVGCGETRRSRADDRNLVALRRRDLRPVRIEGIHIRIGRKSLQRTDGYRLSPPGSAGTSLRTDGRRPFRRRPGRGCSP